MDLKCINGHHCAGKKLVQIILYFCQIRQDRHFLSFNTTIHWGYALDVFVYLENYMCFCSWKSINCFSMLIYQKEEEKLSICELNSVVNDTLEIVKFDLSWLKIMANMAQNIASLFSFIRLYGFPFRFISLNCHRRKFNFTYWTARASFLLFSYMVLFQFKILKVILKIISLKVRTWRALHT